MGTDFGNLAKKIRGGESATVEEMKSTPPEIIISRGQNRQGMVGSVSIVSPIVSALNSRSILVTVNGIVVGNLQENETVKCTGVQGENVIGVGTDHRSQSTVRVNLENGIKKRFSCCRNAGSVELKEVKL